MVTYIYSFENLKSNIENIYGCNLLNKIPLNQFYP